MNDRGTVTSEDVVNNQPHNTVFDLFLSYPAPHTPLTLTLSIISFVSKSDKT